MSASKRIYSCNNNRLSFAGPLIMGVLNVTPDSFSDGGQFLKTGQALCQAEKMINDGATIVDIGGESSRPGAKPVSAMEELLRVGPVIRKIAKTFPKTIISIDTSKPDVAQSALDEGASIINDITGLNDKRMTQIAAQYKTPVVIMHMKGTVQTMQNRPAYKDVVADINSFFAERIEHCLKAGINKIILDPGIGFGKTVKHNMMIINRLREFTTHGYPVMVGHSRKSFIGKILGSEVEQREEATTNITTLLVNNGASIIRVHNVGANRQAAELAHKIMNTKQ